MAAILIDCFLLGLLHGILPDEHTWPITFSYAIGSGSGSRGMRAGVYFGAAFTFQRTLMSELSYLALAPFLRSPKVNAAAYVVVGAAMSIAGWLLLRGRHYGHFHILGHHHERLEDMERSRAILTRHHVSRANAQGTPLYWTLIHGFIAGFGFGAFSLFVNGVAAPAMPGAWLGFLPGLLFGVGTLVMLAAVGAAFGAGLRLVSGVKEQDARRLGARLGATVLFAGGFLFVAAGLVMATGLSRHLPVDMGEAVIGLFVVVIVIPASVDAWRKLAHATRSAGGSNAGRSQNAGR